MTLFSKKKLLLYSFISVIFFYTVSIYFVYERMSIDEKIYLHVVDYDSSESVTPIPIPGFFKKVLWDNFGGREEVLSEQELNGKPFIFLMNLVDDGRRRKELKLKHDETRQVSQELFCLIDDGRFIFFYEDYARKTKNVVLTKYLEDYIQGEICSN